MAFQWSNNYLNVLIKFGLLPFHLYPLTELYILDVFFIYLKIFIPAKMIPTSANSIRLPA